MWYNVGIGGRRNIAGWQCRQAKNIETVILHSSLVQNIKTRRDFPYRIWNSLYILLPKYLNVSFLFMASQSSSFVNVLGDNGNRVYDFIQFLVTGYKVSTFNAPPHLSWHCSCNITLWEKTLRINISLRGSL
jgi:hypothetical protein